LIYGSQLQDEQEGTTAANMFGNQSQTADKDNPPDRGWAME
jgi:hypothetical protein